MSTDVLAYLKNSGVPVSKTSSQGLSPADVTAIADAGVGKLQYGQGHNMQQLGQGKQYGQK